MKKSTF